MKRFVFLMSPSYSGSTLLTLLLARHPRVATVGELKATQMGDVEQYQCSCGQIITHCDFWARLKQQLAERGVPLDLRNFGTNYRMRGSPLIDLGLRMRVLPAVGELVRNSLLAAVPRAAATLRRLNERNRAIAEAVCQVQGADVFLDGSKEPQRFLMMLRAGFPDPHVIHIVRDGRAAANSAIGHEYADLGHAARDWRNTHAQAMRIRRLLPAERFISIRYEDMCADANGVIDSLFRFVGLDPTEGNAVQQRVHHVLGNSMRLRPLQEIRPDERWRRQLSPAQLAVFDRIGGKMNRRFGYA